MAAERGETSRRRVPAKHMTSPNGTPLGKRWRTVLAAWAIVVAIVVIISQPQQAAAELEQAPCEPA